jgi:L-asparagine transporter-like permease
VRLARTKRHRGAAKDSLLPDQFKRISKAGVPAFGIIGSTSLASIAMIFNYLGSTGPADRPGVPELRPRWHVS